jgi:hypothetical protein
MTSIAAIIRSLLMTILEEAAFEAGLPLPEDPALMQEIGWALHGNISHLAIRRHVYRDGTSIDVSKVIAIHVSAFMAAVPVLLAEA